MKKTIVLIGAAAFIAVIAMMLPGCSDNAQTTEAPPVTDSTNTTSGTSPETVTDTSSGETDSEPSEDKYNIPVKNYTLIYEDEFDGAVNTSDWRFRTDEKGGGKNLAINVTTSDGKLNIAFAKQGSTYTGGGIISKELFGYGYYETKCTLFAEGGGLHSAFWLMGGSSSDGTTLPKQNTVFEIDGFEFDSNKPDTISFNLNYKLPRVYGLINAYKVESLSGREAVVGFEWLPDRINWYLDGKLMHTVTQDEELLFYAQQSLWLTALANTTMSGSVNDAKLPSKSSFDYIRYYAKPLKNINLIGASGFEYNDNIGQDSSVDMQTPLAFCEKGTAAASKIERSHEAYAGNCMLTHSYTVPYEVHTYQRLYNIPDANYSLSAMVKSTGGEICRIEISGNGTDPVYADIPVTDEWTKVEIASVPVTTNTVTVSVHTKGTADTRVLVDELCFAACEGWETVGAYPYPAKLEALENVGEILVNTKSATYTSSDGWKKSSVIGAEYASTYKLNADESDWAGWTVIPSSDGEFAVSVFNVESAGKVQKQKVSVYEGEKQLCSFNIGAAAGWEEAGKVTLKSGTEYRVRIENTASNKTMRADSVSLRPCDTLEYSKCVMMNTERSFAYVRGVRTNINNVPAPVLRGSTVYIPREWTEKALGITLTGSTESIGGVEYINAAVLGTAGYICGTDGKTVIITDKGAKISSSTYTAAAELFR